jgi:ribonuclease III
MKRGCDKGPITPARQKQLEQLAHELGVTWKDYCLLDAATTHKSCSGEHKLANYERLEFFGDAVLKFVVAEYLYVNFPELPEGELTEIAAVLISARSLQSLGEEIGLERFIKLGKSVTARGSMVARSMEAILGALYLDSRFRQVRQLIASRICCRAALVASDAVKENYKAQLQQYTQARGQGTPAYAVLEVSGKAHAPVFQVAVSVGERQLAQGTGNCKKAAEQAAARAAFEKLNSPD